MTIRMRALTPSGVVASILELECKRTVALLLRQKAVTEFITEALGCGFRVEVYM